MISRDMIVPFRRWNVWQSHEVIAQFLGDAQEKPTKKARRVGFGAVTERTPESGVRNDEKDHYEWAEACSDATNLSDWEWEFSRSLMEQLEASRRLTAKQVEILERIYGKV